MGEVYRARDTRLERPVAVKIVPSHVAGNPHLRERFDREVKVLAALSHPNIVAIHDVGTLDGIPYAAMELLDGATLRDRMAGAPLPLRTAVDYAVQIGRGLAAAHDKGIVHRDLKPENVFVTQDGHVKILDFGLASERAIPAEPTDATRAPQTERGTILGTVGYLSPEQARGETADARSDIFSFGCVLYEMVSGHRAFMGDSSIEVMHAILKDHPHDLLTSRRDIPPALDRLITRCVEKAPSARFQSARDLVFALENLLDASAPAARQAPAASGGRRRGWAVAAVCVIGLITGHSFKLLHAYHSARGWTDGCGGSGDGRDPEGEPEGDRRGHGMGDPLPAERRHPRAAWRAGGGAGLPGTGLRRGMA